MKSATIDMVYDELLSIRKEIKFIEQILVCEEKLSEKERAELKADLDEALKEGGTNFRDVKR